MRMRKRCGKSRRNLLGCRKVSKMLETFPKTAPTTGNLRFCASRLSPGAKSPQMAQKKPVNCSFLPMGLWAEKPSNAKMLRKDVADTVVSFFLSSKSKENPYNNVWLMLACFGLLARNVHPVGRPSTRQDAGAPDKILPSPSIPLPRFARNKPHHVAQRVEPHILSHRSIFYGRCAKISQIGRFGGL